MKTLMAVRKGEAIDTIYRDFTIISFNAKHNRKTVRLHGAAHKTYVEWRQKYWLKNPNDPYMEPDIF